MNDLRLVPIDASNWRRAYALRPDAEGERFVAPNAYSLVEAAYDDTMVPLLALRGDEAVGFAMYGVDPADGRPWLVRLMIAGRYQGRGYGRQLLAAVLVRMREEHPDRPIRLGVDPKNARAERLYRNVGFRHAGFEIDGEAIMDLAETTEVPSRPADAPV